MEKIFFEKLSSEAKALWLNQNIKFNLFSDGETDLLAVCGLNKKDQDAVLPYLKEIKAALLAEKNGMLSAEKNAENPSPVYENIALP